MQAWPAISALEMLVGGFRRSERVGLVVEPADGNSDNDALLFIATFVLHKQDAFTVARGNAAAQSELTIGSGIRHSSVKIALEKADQ